MVWTAPQTDRLDGPFVGDEREVLTGFLEYQRATFLWKCSGLTGEQLARRSVPPSPLSLLGLVRHMTDVERSWFVRRVAGRPVEMRYFDTDPDDPDIEFTGAAAEGAEKDYALLISAIDEARAALAEFPFDHVFEHPRHGPVSTRWVVTHMIEEYARHNGHADFLRELIDGATGE
ncbi:DinB family protein [Kibdelosporangium persicum]|uniref:Damage-inducible protein DinB n=1 Tax=Kibdelosporangium persicum TaxID=2698649 RepID=A0ABX2FAH1_9PSEU|nr:DinB family protein [Kibdelosporangium persicum]NRN68376.1 putative damage-inducible protein DinB [Kibdelosporangium persicum]